MRSTKTAVLPLLALLVLAAPAAVPAAAAADLELSFATADPAVSALLPVGGELWLRGVPLDGARDLVLRRIEVFAPDAVLQVRREGGDERLPVPGNAYFAGGIAGAARSRAMVSVLESGEVRGIMTEGGRYWLLGRQPGEALTRVAEVDSAALAADTGGFHCATDDLDAVELLAAPGALPGAERPAAASAPAPSVRTESAPLGVLFTARAAIETDQEYLALFGGNTTQAINYIGDLIAFGSTIYSAEVDTSLLVGSVQLWQTTDPWTQSQANCLLYQLGRYWNVNNGGVSRSFVHMLSGRPSNVGIAWVGVLCNGAFNVNHQGACPALSPQTSNYGGDYGLTGGIDADFDVNNPAALWDIIATIHEIGHNFNSPHTHCYANLGGNSNPVDQCFNGQCGTTNCYCGATSLPCPTPGAGCGTIMSYCHFQTGGLSNIAFSFGEGHPWGVAPQRVPDRMSAHVVSRAGSNPGCLAFVPSGSVIFDDGFESGGTSAWSNTAP